MRFSANNDLNFSLFFAYISSYEIQVILNTFMFFLLHLLHYLVCPLGGLAYCFTVKYIFFFFCFSIDTNQERNFQYVHVLLPVFAHKYNFAAHAVVYFVLPYCMENNCLDIQQNIFFFSAPHNNDNHLVCEVLTT